MKRKIPLILKDSLIFTALIAALFFGLWGIKPTSTTPFIQVGHFRLSPFIKGLTLYQQDESLFYNFSPHDDYFIDQEGEYKTLITKEDIMNGRFKINSDQNSTRDYFLSLLGFYQPLASYQNQSQTIKYRTKIHNNSIEIIREVSGFPQIKQAMAIAITLSFEPDDYLFNQQLELVRNESESPILWENVSGNSVFILNPQLPGVIQVLAQPYQKIKINRLNHFLALEEIGESKEAQTETKIVIKIFNNFTEIK